jgi:hypothetical protein
MKQIFKHTDIEDILEDNGLGFYIAARNIPGHLPDGDTQHFRDFESAKEYAVECIEEVIEDLYCSETDTDTQMVDDLMLVKGQVLKQNESFCVIANGTAFAVEEVKFSDDDLLKSVEENELSEIFDQDVLPSVLKQYGEDDLIAVNEAFNNWSDALCKDGYIHEMQYNRYCYVGKLAE